MGKIDPLLGLWIIYELPKLKKLNNMKLKTLIKKIKSGEITDKQHIENLINNYDVGNKGLSFEEYYHIPGDGLQERLNYILNKCNFKDKKQKQKQQKQMTKSKTSSRSKKVSKVKIETTPSGSYRVRKSSHGVVVNRTFKKKKDAVTFRDAFYA